MPLDLLPFLDAVTPTPEAVLDLVYMRGALGDDVQDVAIIAQLLDENLLPRQLVNPPNPNDASDVSDYVTVSQVEWNSEADVQRSAKFTFTEFPGWGQINFVRDFIKLYLEYRDADDGPLKRFSCGVFCFAIPERHLDAAIDWDDVNGFDPGWRLNKLYVIWPYVFPAGANIIECVYTILMADKLPPSLGGRQPSGVSGWIESGDPCGTGGNRPLPITSARTGYSDECQRGVPIEDAAYALDAAGYMRSPDGTVWNPFSGAMVDTPTGRPVDPFTCSPMPAVAGHLNTFLVDTVYGPLWFNTRTGLFYAEGYPRGEGIEGATDPYTVAPYPPGAVQYQPVPTGADTSGQFPPPLLTWPYDHDAQGPFFGQKAVLRRLGYCATGIPMVQSRMYGPAPDIYPNHAGYLSLVGPATGDPVQDLWNPMSGVLTDPNTGAPIDPWTCRPMRLLSYSVSPAGDALTRFIKRYTTTDGRLVFEPATGGFILAAYVGSSADNAGAAQYWDIFTNTPANLPSPYRSPAYDSPLAPLPPLATWPWDWNGAGPFYSIGNRAPCNPAPAASGHTPKNPFDYSGVTLPAGATLVANLSNMTPATIEGNEIWTWVGTNPDGGPSWVEYDERTIAVPGEPPLPIDPRDGTPMIWLWDVPAMMTADGLIYDTQNGTYRTPSGQFVDVGQPVGGGVLSGADAGSPTSLLDAGPTSFDLAGYAALPLGSRHGTGTIEVLAPGNYALAGVTCVADPALPAYQWCEQNPGTANAYGTTDALSGATIGAGDWTVTVKLSGAPNLVYAGPLSISAHIDEVTSDGRVIAVADLPTGGAVQTDDQTVELTTGSANPGGHHVQTTDSRLRVLLTLHTDDGLFATVADETAAITLIAGVLNVPSSTVLSVVNPLDAPGSSSSAPRPEIPNQTGTFVPWPDTNAPGITPAGCDFFGANIPRYRIKIPPSNLTLSAPLPFTDAHTVRDMANTLLGMALYDKLNWDRDGNATSGPIPWQYTDADGNAYIPTDADLTYETNPEEDPHPGVVTDPLLVRLADSTAFWNLTKVGTQNNKAAPMYVVVPNMSDGSQVSIPNAGYVMVKVILDNRIMTLGDLTDRAHIEAINGAMSDLAVEWTTVVNPLHDIFMLCRLTVFRVDEDTGERIYQIDSRTTRYHFRETYWSLDLGNMTMLHRGGKAVPV